MENVVEIIDAGIFMIRNVLSPEECATLIARAETLGFEAASVRTSSGPQMMTNVRNNDRITLVDTDLAQVMWLRVAPFLPILDGERPVGVDPQLRFYRYLPGQQFKRHKDGAVTNSEGHTSKLSYLIYLNEDCEGGTTLFRDYKNVDGDRVKSEFSVSPTTGSALLFRHERWHEGAPVISGKKYLLRSDVFYSAASKEQG